MCCYSNPSWPAQQNFWEQILVNPFSRTCPTCKWWGRVASRAPPPPPPWWCPGIQKVAASSCLVSTWPLSICFWKRLKIDPRIVSVGKILFWPQSTGLSTEQWGCKHPRQPWSSPQRPCWRTWGRSPRWEPSARPTGPARVQSITGAWISLFKIKGKFVISCPYKCNETLKTLATPGSLAWWGAKIGYFNFLDRGSVLPPNFKIWGNNTSPRSHGVFTHLALTITGCLGRTPLPSTWRKSS